MSLLDLLGRNTTKGKNQDNIFNTEQEGGIQEEEQGKLGEDEETQEDMVMRAEKMVDGLVGRQEEDGIRGADTSKDKQESESESEEEIEYQEDVSTEEHEEDCNKICSVWKSRGSLFICDECNNWLHESYTQSTVPFLYEFCLRKKRLRERE